MSTGSHPPALFPTTRSADNGDMRLPNWTLLEWLTALGALVAILTFVVGAVWTVGKIVVGRFRRRREAERRERDAVRGLLEWLWGHRVLYEPLYQEDPVGALESVREIRARLREEIGQLPEGSEAIPHVRDMHEAGVEFLRRVEPLPKPTEREPLPVDWMQTEAWQQHNDALIGLRQVFNPKMNLLFDAYGIEKPPPRVKVAYIEPLFEMGRDLRRRLPGAPRNTRDYVKAAQRLLYVFHDLAGGDPQAVVLRKDAAIRAWLTTDRFDALVAPLMEEDYIEHAHGVSRQEAFRITPEGIRKVERYRLIAKGLHPDTGKPLQES